MGSKSRKKKDNVNHPEHYLRGGMEAIDVIEAFGLDYHDGQVVKYILRADHKDDGLEDREKALWYLARKIARMKAKM